MAQNKTGPTDASVGAFIAAVPSDRRRQEAEVLREVFERASGVPAVMWGPSIVGFGQQHNRTPAGREGETPVMGFSPRKAAILLYGLLDAGEEPGPDLRALGTFTHGASCLYVKRLSDIDLDVLVRLARAAFNGPP